MRILLILILIASITAVKADEIYNLTGFTKPSESWDYPEENFFANLNIRDYSYIIRKLFGRHFGNYLT